jgi:hypothetical protein
MPLCFFVMPTNLILTTFVDVIERLTSTTFGNCHAVVQKNGVSDLRPRHPDLWI